MRGKVPRIFLVVLTAFALSMVSTAAVAHHHLYVPKAKGDVALTGPMQYASFKAYDFGLTGDRGKIEYTNFEYPVVGTGVWNISGTHTLTFTRGGTFVHNVTIDTLKALSPEKTKFKGSGTYATTPPTYPFTISGKVKGSHIEFCFRYTYQGAPKVHGFGTIAADGSMSGLAYDGDVTPMTWTAPAGSAHEVLSYETWVTCAVESGADATFGFTIPNGFPGLSGLPIVVKVHDGGTPGTNGDTWAHGVATSACVGPVTPYVITGGNLVVH
jgi:hypothetical protein